MADGAGLLPPPQKGSRGSRKVALATLLFVLRIWVRWPMQYGSDGQWWDQPRAPIVLLGVFSETLALRCRDKGKPVVGRGAKPRGLLPSWEVAGLSNGGGATKLRP